MPQRAPRSQTPVPPDEYGPPVVDPRPPRPIERDPDVYPMPAPLEDPPLSPPDPGEPLPEIDDPPVPDEKPGDPAFF